uniref:Glucosyl-3-phosphoglycerate synthase n=1 Tax=Paenibacillus athensensis TaxID=1967502 RepID=A0A4Y8PRW5_9BACL
MTAGEAHWRAWGQRAGRADAALHPIAGAPNYRKALNALWQPHSRALPPGLSASACYAAAQGYAAGYGQASGLGAADWVLLPTERTIAAVVCAMNEEATIAGVLRELQRLPLDELYVIVNGSRDRTLERVRQCPDAIVAYYPEALGHDVGRAIGAKLSSADIVLFVDGDFVVPAERLAPFITAVSNGMDVALNNITPYLPPFSRWDQVTTMKRFLNVTMGRPELKANSLTAVPHALSRAAIERIGYRELMVPPKAQVRAMLGGLQIGAPAGVNVIAANRQRGTNRGRLNPVSRLIIGDHAEAIELAMAERGERVSFPDTMRQRKMIRKGEGACR